MPNLHNMIMTTLDGIVPLNTLSTFQLMISFLENYFSLYIFLNACILPNLSFSINIWTSVYIWSMVNVPTVLMRYLCNLFQVTLVFPTFSIKSVSHRKLSSFPSHALSHSMTSIIIDVHPFGCVVFGSSSLY